ncbi:Phosphatidylinositolglycan class N-domain-containing protein [Gorgonomyces haynaldii]|nr:Phosphatidylinositolglycan class N-domain-containing protein [Gorgonomyces haynaldii]
MTPVQPPSPPAKRLFLYVGDGLRADRLYENQMERAPFLKSKVFHEGTWGVSHTRVPTESRPGHVALIAGFYEDVSAVTKGWKTNPVNFDSVFNESRHTWSFGSPDILPMFAYGASDPSKVEMFMYEAETEDFSKEDASDLDTWVFDHVERLFEEAKTNNTLNDMMHADKTVFFLHLLGLDTNGHAHRPHSPEYLENIKIVDRGLQNMEKMIQDFYGDDKSAFVFTADHGMSKRGSHGDGDPENTQTPLIAWGAGVAKPNRTHLAGHDMISFDWGLDEFQRVDVNQADIAPLMSVLIGVPYPLNSVGKLPIQYLDNSDEYKALASLGNARQILAQLLVKQEQKRQREIVFRPFEGLNHRRTIQEIQKHIHQGEYLDAERKSSEFIDLCLLGLRYYQTYDWFFLRTLVSLGYGGWIVFSTTFILQTYTKTRPIKSKSSSMDLLAAVGFVGFSIFLYVKHSPVMYYLYALFPFYFWSQCFKAKPFLLHILKQTKPKVIWHSVYYVLSLELLVYSYFDRRVLTVWLAGAGIVWPFTMPKEFKKRHATLVNLWRLVSLLCSVFTVLPVDMEESSWMIGLGGFLIILSGIAALYLLPQYTQSLPSNTVNQKPKYYLLMVQISAVLVSVLVVLDTIRSLNNKQGLPPLNAFISWLLLVFGISVPVLDKVQGKTHFLNRLVVIYLSFAPLFVLFSVSYESLFYFFFSMTILVWMLLEQRLYFFETKVYRGQEYAEIVQKQDKHRDLQLSDMRIATFFMLFINIAFFGTGNLASISSFSIESVYRFTTLFLPFLMGALLLLKIMVPFFLLSSVFAILSRTLDLPSFSLFLLVLSTTDIMTLNFFFLVQDNGSWLEIGTSISHFIIATTFIVFQIILFSVSHFLVGGVLVPQKRDKKRE